MNPINPKARFHLIYFIIAFWGVILLRESWVSYTQVAHVPYSQFQTYLREGKVSEVIISSNYLRGTLKEPLKDGKTEFLTTRVENDLAEELSAHDVKFSRVVENTFWRDVLSWVIPMVAFAAIWLFIIRRMADRSGASGGFMSLGKSKAKVYVETDTKTTFGDVAGVDEAKDELKEVVGFLKSPQDYSRLGARIPKGVLLIGPPGTGKTLLARAVAGEAGVPFFSISGSEFVEMFVGLGAARVRDLFEQARQKAPCIIFIDELDALGKSRNNPMAQGHDEKEQTLNQLLVEMDGFDSKTNIILLGATNRPEILDPALLRAGRFDRQVLVDRPDKQGRLAILKVHGAKVMISSDTSFEQVADLTPGFTGADLANLVNEAAVVATRRGAESVNLGDFTVAVERIIAGLEKKSRILNPLEKKVVAHHEMGHAFVAASLPLTDPVHKISIIPRGVGALGYTLQRPIGDRYLMTQAELKNRMAVLLGGRAAELLIFDHLSTGASDDLVKVTDIARSMVARYGMVEELGSVAYDTDSQGFLAGSYMPDMRRRFSEETAREIDLAVRELVEEALERALSILHANRPLLEEGASHLLEKETLDQNDLAPIFARLKPHSPPGRALQTGSRAPGVPDIPGVDAHS